MIFWLLDLASTAYRPSTPSIRYCMHMQVFKADLYTEIHVYMLMRAAEGRKKELSKQGHVHMVVD